MKNLFVLFLALSSITVFGADEAITFEKLYTVKTSGQTVNHALVKNKILYTANILGEIVSTLGTSGDVIWHKNISSDDGIISEVTTLAIDQKGELLVAATSSGFLLVLNTTDGSILKTIKRPSKARINTIDISPDGSTLATGDSNGNVLVWNIETAQYEVLSSYDWNVLSVKFSSDGFLLICEPKSIKLWDTRSKKSVRDLKDPEAPAGAFWYTGIGVSPDIGTVLVLSNKHVILFDVATGLIELKITSQDDNPFLSAALSIDKNTIVTSSNNSEINVWNATNGEKLNSQISFSMTATSMLIPIDESGIYYVGGTRLNIFQGWIVPISEVWKYKKIVQ